MSFEKCEQPIHVVHGIYMLDIASLPFCGQDRSAKHEYMDTNVPLRLKSFPNERSMAMAFVLATIMKKENVDLVQHGGSWSFDTIH